MYCMYGIKFTVKNTVFYNNIRIFESPTQESPVEIDPDQMDVQPDAPRKNPPPQFTRRSNTPPQGLLPPFQEDTPRATPTSLVAPPAMTRSASKGGPPPPRGGG